MLFLIRRRNCVIAKILKNPKINCLKTKVHGENWENLVREWVLGRQTLYNEGYRLNISTDGPRAE